MGPFDLLDPNEIGRLMLGAGMGNPDALATLDTSNVVTPNDPNFMDIINPMGRNAGLALGGVPWGNLPSAMNPNIPAPGGVPNYGGGPPGQPQPYAPTMSLGGGFAMPPGVTPAPVTPEGGPQPRPDYGDWTMPPPAQPRGGPRGIGQGLPQADNKPIFSPLSLKPEMGHRLPRSQTLAETMMNAMGLLRGGARRSQQQ